MFNSKFAQNYRKGLFYLYFKFVISFNIRFMILMPEQLIYGDYKLGF